MQRIYIIAAVAVAAIVGLWFFAPGMFGLGSAAPKTGGNKAPVVTVVAATKEVFVEEIEAIATSLASESVTITAKVADTIGAINFGEGQEVAAGDILVEMTSTQQAADLVAARAELAEAEKAYQRAADLVAKGIAARATLDSATAARDAARGRVQSIEARLADTIIKAPFAGVVGLRNVSVGSYVKPGDIITTLDDIRVIKGDFTVPEQYLAILKPGLTLQVDVAAYPGQSFDGKVASVDTRIDPATRAVKVRAELPNAEYKLKPGMLMAARLKVSERTAVSVPESALVSQGDRRYVFRIDAEAKAERVEVKTGLIKPGSVEIVEGLVEGDRIVSEGTNKVIPGQPVQIDGAPPPAQPVTAAAVGGRT
ncbi:Multidrug resistance protein MdtA [Alphaproteobacteria bacterium SO-S41]|nr:Multidrug resistance protein MdtA [Alphaproteobacteria bacterium SO-S41]